MADVRDSAMIKITFINPNTNAELVADLDETMTVAEVIKELCEHNFLPAPPTGYFLQVKGKMQVLNENETLMSGNVYSGDLVLVARSQRGGGAPEIWDLVVKAGIPVATGVIGAVTSWLAARHGRRVRVKTDNLEVEAETVEELKRILDLVEERSRHKGTPKSTKL
jgi:WXG100 protein secretion system (Wss), protein YukD/Effector Associated Constant Component 1